MSSKQMINQGYSKALGSPPVVPGHLISERDNSFTACSLGEAAGEEGVRLCAASSSLAPRATVGSKGHLFTLREVHPCCELGEFSGGGNISFISSSVGFSRGQGPV